jgi:hypothetical protein
VEVKGGKAEGRRLEFTVTHERDGERHDVRISGEVDAKGETLKGKWSTPAGDSGEWSAEKPVTL